MRYKDIPLENNADISETQLANGLGGHERIIVFDVLLRDQTSIYYAQKGKKNNNDNCDNHHIIWATDNYESLGKGYQERDEITLEAITHKNDRIIRPRSIKSKAEQLARTRDKAEVFTPSWVCNLQNNLVDEAWFGRKDVFNSNRDDHTWDTYPNKIAFPEGRTWIDYVYDTRLEITCGEAPYLVSRYDTVTGEYIPVKNRIGFFDRKLRIVSENTEAPDEWVKYAFGALSSIYGYEWQGDSLLLAREAMLCTFLEYFFAKFPDEEILPKTLFKVANIISWNIWQMDGLTATPPMSVSEDLVEKYWKREEQLATERRVGGQDLFADTANVYEDKIPFCMVQDWKGFGIKKGKPERFVDSM